MRRRSPLLRLATAALTLSCGGCDGWQSALDQHGAEAVRLGQLIWFIVGVCTLVWFLVVAVLAIALLRRGQTHTSNRALTFSVGAASVATALIIAVFTLVSFLASRGDPQARENALTIQVRGFQWWWEITYPADGAAGAFVTANEIHVPVGRSIRIELSSADVIHSFWAPSLAGKLDLIPGRHNELIFTVLRPGVYRGQCAEFCGLQHAHMSFFVIAEPAEAFAAWRRNQSTGQQPPSDPEEQEGQRVFLATPCAACHTVRGTPAQGKLGPDLTHVGSRRYIGAGLLETTRGSLAAWIADPQTLKPGNNMPRVTLGASELRAVSAYLAGLK